jgi:hypothetical protein
VACNSAAVGAKSRRGHPEHFLLAATGLVVWIIYLAADKDALAWIAFVALVFVALLGWTMFFGWARQRSQVERRLRTPQPSRPAPSCGSRFRLLRCTGSPQ